VRRPDRLRWELANFADEHLPAEWSATDPNEPTIATELTLSDGRRVPTWVQFPYEYPLEHPHVSVLAGLVGPPHAIGGLLCLFDNPGAQWHPQRSAAQLVNENARSLLEDALIRGPEAIAAHEEQIPDRASSRYLVDTDHAVLVPDPFWNELPEGASGGWFVLSGSGSRRCLDAVIPLGRADESIKERVRCKEGIALGKWVALDEAPAGLQVARSLFDHVRAVAPSILDPIKLDGDGQESVYRAEWIAFTYPEQGPMRGQWRRGWTFIELTGPDTVPPTAERMPQTQALTLAERQLRLPELVGLEQAKIVVVGVGSLGSKIALELAKAGAGHLVLIDDDRYDVNNAVRHEMPAWQAGSRKTLGMAAACVNHNPFCNVEWENTRIGTGANRAVEFLRCLNGAHLVVETTGSRETTRVAQRYCRATGVPLLTASITQASRGGDLVLLTAADCFDCFLATQEAGKVPKPDAGEQPLVIPVGCIDPAFSGAGFDSSELASATARMAIRATGLCSYPPLDHNWAVANFTGNPRWIEGTLAPDPHCGHHG
jgi:hypothetical protein